MRQLLEFIVQSLVDQPEKVEIREVDNEQGTVMEVRVAREDLGKIIGRQGRTAKAIRSIVQAASARMGKRVILEILE